MTCLDLHWPQEAASAAADGTVFHWDLEAGSGVQLSPPEALYIIFLYYVIEYYCYITM